MTLNVWLKRRCCSLLHVHNTTTHIHITQLKKNQSFKPELTTGIRTLVLCVFLRFRKCCLWLETEAEQLSEVVVTMLLGHTIPVDLKMKWKCRQRCQCVKHTLNASSWLAVVPEHITQDPIINERRYPKLNSEFVFCIVLTLCGCRIQRKEIRIKIVRNKCIVTKNSNKII